MGVNRGKDFESVFEKDVIETLSECTLVRLHDQMTGYRGTSKNICDFILYNNNYLYFIETKTHYGNTWNFSNYSQYDLMKSYVGNKGVRVGVVLWVMEHDKVVYIPTKTVTQMKEDGKKSFNIKDLSSDKYRIIEIPSTKKRVYMKSDYSVLETLQEGD